MKVTLNTPIRFVAVSWDEGWEYDRPVFLVEPIVRLAPDDRPLDAMIEDVALDIVFDTEAGEEVPDVRDWDRDHFARHEWTVELMKLRAEAALAGHQLTKPCVALEQWVVFFTHSTDGLVVDVFETEAEAITFVESRKQIAA